MSAIENSGIRRYLYEPEYVPQRRHQWPTLGEMILSGKRVVMVSAESFSIGSSWLRLELLVQFHANDFLVPRLQSQSDSGTISIGRVHPYVSEAETTSNLCIDVLNLGY